MKQQSDRNDRDTCQDKCKRVENQVDIETCFVT
jgi:hypothetical protein